MFYSSCKKCITCSNICYRCINTNNDIAICSTDFTSWESYNRTIRDIELTGRTCNLITPTLVTDICDKPNSVKNFQSLYEQQQYKCATK